MNNFGEDILEKSSRNKKIWEASDEIYVFFLKKNRRIGHKYNIRYCQFFFQIFIILKMLFWSFI